MTIFGDETGLGLAVGFIVGPGGCGGFWAVCVAVGVGVMVGVMIGVGSK
jgi:hypothetical protein